MPRNGSSVYSLPAGNPVIPGTIIATTWANTTLTDIATALTNSLSTDGSTATVSLAGKTMSGGTFTSPVVSGLLDVTSGQIKFPAVQVPSANVNTLDDYEEGTWTPSASFGTVGNLNVVYVRRVGTYTKIGDRVLVGLAITTSTFTHTTAGGSARVTGFPFAFAEDWGDSVLLAGALLGADTQVAILAAAAATFFEYNITTNTTGANVIPGTGQFTSGPNLNIRICSQYRA
jgi:hypothetical protein